MAGSVRFKKVSYHIGAEVKGIDLSQELDPEHIASLRNALLAHKVLFFRNQGISSRQHLNLARAFGQTVAHPSYPSVVDLPHVNLLLSSKEKPSKIDTWHTDMTFLEEPPLGTILRARELPKVGGDTMWANLAAAWDGLSDRMKQHLDGLRACHSFAFGFRHSLEEHPHDERLGQAVRNHPPVWHPVVRRHPETGQPGLFVNRLFTTRIADVSEQESRALLGFLFEHIEMPEFGCRFQWQRDSLAFWDNRVTLHRPVNDFQPGFRKMERVTIAGTRPR